MKVGERIAAWRASAGMTQDDLANAVGVTVAAVYRWEGRGKKGNPAPRKTKRVSPSQDNLEKIVAAFGITMERFYGRVPRSRVAA